MNTISEDIILQHKGSIMFNRYLLGAVAPIVMIAGCSKIAGEDTADPKLARFTVEVKGMT